MRMNRKAALAAGAGIAVAFLGACSDSATGPSAASARPSAPSFAVGDAIGDLVTSVPAVGRVTICKVGNVAGTFTVTGVSDQGGTGTSAGAGFVVQPGECRVAAFGNSSSGSAWAVTVTETSAGLQSVVEQGVLDENEGADPGPVVGGESPAAPGTVYTINLIHGYRLTFTNNVEAGCTYTQGFWKTHGPVPTGSNVNEWPATNFTIGGVDYTDAQLLAILQTAPKGNGWYTLAHQLIAAKLNIANGADGSSVATAIADADALLASGSTLDPSAVSSLVTTLTNFNEGLIGPGHCDDEILVS
jgi:hypothetical protein